MKIFDLFSEEDLKQQIDEKMVKETHHPFLPLVILNYTQVAQFTPEKWNHVTDLCRGLVYDVDSMEIVARGFKKFWNFADTRHPETMPENLPSSLPLITRKMDGSLGIGYKEGGKWAIATRGSFTSDQAQWATRWIQDHRFDAELEGYTPLFEIVYPENQIVVKYDWSGLILLALVKIEDGSEVGREELELFGSKHNLRVVESFDKPIESLSKEDAPNEEGYVVSWHDRNPPLRVKIKYETYVRLHRIMTQTNPVTIWEELKDKGTIEHLMENVPEDFKEWARSVGDSIVKDFQTIEDEARTAFGEYSGPPVTDPESRKQFAFYAAKQGRVTPILFSMLDGKDFSPIIWKMVRPSGNKTFKVDES